MSALLKRAWDLVLATAESLDDALCSTPEERDERARRNYGLGAKRQATAATAATAATSAGGSGGANVLDKAAGAARSTGETSQPTAPEETNLSHGAGKSENDESYEQFYQRTHVSAPATEETSTVPREYEGAALQTMLDALPENDAALVQAVSTPLYDLSCNDWIIGKLICHKARQDADGALHLHMRFKPDEPADAAPIALLHEYSLKDLAYLQRAEERLPLLEKERPCGTFGVAQ